MPSGKELDLNFPDCEEMLTFIHDSQNYGVGEKRQNVVYASVCLLSPLLEARFGARSLEENEQFWKGLQGPNLLLDVPLRFSTGREIQIPAKQTEQGSWASSLPS